jgi:KDO2-lipid IV(A) lauroyltransferase
MGTPLFTAFAIELPDGTYRVDAEPLEMPELTGDKNADILAIMTAVNSRIEKVVRANPEQWLWLHDRWRWAREKGLIGDD